ncbi:hypothetical protein DL98DRAFT_529017 [Cadophora sp. DSE1049]|nr:hypothetical protein DL98DRAFT_529017 [Cadophora sp. DSE1049]
MMAEQDQMVTVQSPQPSTRQSPKSGTRWPQTHIKTPERRKSKTYRSATPMVNILCAEPRVEKPPCIEIGLLPAPEEIDCFRMLRRTRLQLHNTLSYALASKTHQSATPMVNILGTKFQDRVERLLCIKLHTSPQLIETLLHDAGLSPVREPKRNIHSRVPHNTAEHRQA